MKYAIIGMGFIFSRHKEAIEKNGGEVVFTCDTDETKNPDYFDYQLMFADSRFKEKVDAIVIATPNDLHPQMVKDALATGKKVLCEKPLSITNNFHGLDGVNVVLQLRYHSSTEEIKKTLTGLDKIQLIMRVYRDDKWWQSWRGDEKRSGGILLGLAIHMFDYLVFLLGDQYEVISSEKSKKKCFGSIKWPTAMVDYFVEVLDSNQGQTRKFVINGKSFELCDKDNLSFAGYHDIVHREFIAGRGIPLTEARKSLELVFKL